jgi:hypothetical protein
MKPSDKANRVPSVVSVPGMAHYLTQLPTHLVTDTEKPPSYGASFVILPLEQSVTSFMMVYVMDGIKPMVRT